MKLLAAALILTACTQPTPPADAMPEISTTYQNGVAWCGDHDPMDGGRRAIVDGRVASTEQCFFALADCQDAGFTDCAPFAEYCFAIPQLDQVRCFPGKYAAQDCDSGWWAYAPDAAFPGCFLMSTLQCTATGLAEGWCS